jgi:heme oxygenase
MNEPLAQLREATRALHDRTEAVVGGDRILAGQISAAEFDRLMRCNYYLYARTEPLLLTAAARLAPDLHPLLPELLPALRRSCATRSIELDPFHNWPEPGLDFTRPGLYGMAYVLLGSHHGAKVLYPSLNRHPEIAPAGGLNFYAALAALPDRNWRRFLHLLAAEIRTPDQIAAATAQARSLFSFFRRVYQHGLIP